MHQCREELTSTPAFVLWRVLFTATLAWNAGCLAEPGPTHAFPDAGEKANSGGSSNDLQGALWNDPLFEPHAQYGWPTLTRPNSKLNPWWQTIPHQSVPPDPRELVHVVSSPESSTIDGMAVFGRLAVTPSGHIYDLFSPANPRLVGTASVQPDGRQVVLLPYPDGTLVAAFATVNPVIPLWDLTDPTKPSEMAVIELPSGGHTVAAVPGTPILYNANAVGSTYYPHEIAGGRSVAQVEIYDLTKPDEPKLVKEWKNGLGCHALSFYVRPSDGAPRGICAAVDATQLWDMTNPIDPRVISTIPMPHGQQGVPGPPMAPHVSHSAFVNDDATVLAVSDETGAGLGPACDAYVEQDGQATSGPSGDVWFYDIADEGDPILTGWVGPSAHFATNPPPLVDDHPIGRCVGHVGHLVPHEERDLGVVAFYAGGVALIDFTDPANPRILDQWADGHEPTDVWYNNGHLIAASGRGVHVLALG